MRQPSRLYSCIDLHAAAVPSPTVAQTLCLHSIKFVSCVRAAGSHSADEVSDAGSCAGPLWGAVPAA
eukprot:1161212-Pelagomonas_calceolata.AAC.8